MRMPSRSCSVPILAILFAVSLIVLTTRTHANGLLQTPSADTAGQEPQTPPTGAGGPQGGQDRPGRPEVSTEPKPYDKVITKDAKSDEGVFTVHPTNEKRNYEIPKSKLTKNFLSS